MPPARQYKAPSIRWDDYGPNWESKRQEVLKRDAYTCQRCGVSLRSTSARAIHHKKHLANGGLTVNRNLESLCINCHNAEHGIVTNKPIVAFKPSKKQVKAFYARKGR